MAIYIEIEKMKEESDSAQYRFRLLDKSFGILTINKNSGEIILLEPLPNENGEKHFARAAYKIKKYWKNGNLPDKTCWAS